MYKYEKNLVDDFKSLIIKTQNPFSLSNIAFEFYYMNGKVDIVGMKRRDQLFAFEAKLIRWREALNQAYRNSSFAHYSYVVLPKSIIKTVLKNEYEFIRRGIGLCSVESSSIKIEILASKREPIQPWLTETAFDFIEKE